MSTHGSDRDDDDDEEPTQLHARARADRLPADAEPSTLEPQLVLRPSVARLQAAGAVRPPSVSSTGITPSDAFRLPLPTTLDDDADTAADAPRTQLPETLEEPEEETVTDARQVVTLSDPAIAIPSDELLATETDALRRLGPLLVVDVEQLDVSDEAAHPGGGTLKIERNTTAAPGIVPSRAGFLPYAATLEAVPTTLPSPTLRKESATPGPPKTLNSPTLVARSDDLRPTFPVVTTALVPERTLVRPPVGPPSSSPMPSRRPFVAPAPVPVPVPAPPATARRERTKPRSGFRRGLAVFFVTLLAGAAGFFVLGRLGRTGGWTFSRVWRESVGTSPVGSATPALIASSATSVPAPPPSAAPVVAVSASAEGPTATGSSSSGRPPEPGRTRPPRGVTPRRP